MIVWFKKILINCLKLLIKYKRKKFNKPPTYTRLIHIFILIIMSLSIVILMLILQHMLPILQVINIDSIKDMVILIITHTLILMQVFILSVILALGILLMDMFQKENYVIICTILQVLDMYHQPVPEDYLSRMMVMLVTYQKATQDSENIHQKIKLSNLSHQKIKHQQNKPLKKVLHRLLYSYQNLRNL